MENSDFLTLQMQGFSGEYHKMLALKGIKNGGEMSTNGANRNFHGLGAIASATRERFRVGVCGGFFAYFFCGRKKVSGAWDKVPHYFFSKP